MLLQNVCLKMMIPFYNLEIKRILLKDILNYDDTLIGLNMGYYFKLLVSVDGCNEGQCQNLYFFGLS